MTVELGNGADRTSAVRVDRVTAALAVELGHRPDLPGAVWMIENKRSAGKAAQAITAEIQAVLGETSRLSQPEFVARCVGLLGNAAPA